MGNEVCCKDQVSKNDLPSHPLPVVRKSNISHGKTNSSLLKQSNKSPQTSFISHSDNVQIPKLTPQIQTHLMRQKPLEDRLPKNPTIKQFGDEVYVGEVNYRGKPDGYGKMYRNNGSLFIGRFQNGIAQGPGYYIKPDGSYYSGNMKNNKADDAHGVFWSQSLQYSGEIHNNQFNGKGKQKGQNHQFEGQYKDGQKVYGTMSWRDGPSKSIYTGSFNAHGAFDGKGKLEQWNIGTYEGEFQDGEKHGHGEFNYIGGKKYIGQYYYGVKQGFGKTINKNGEMTYEGEWKNGLPHGKGRARNKEGKYVERVFDQGLDQEFIQ